MSTRQLGAIGLVLMGAWFFILAIGDVPDAVWTLAHGSEGFQRWALTLSVALMAAAGVTLALTATAVSRAALVDEAIDVRPSLEELLPLVFALGGVWLLATNVFHLIRLVLPFLFHEQESVTPSDELWYDAGTSALALLLFVKSRALAGLWLRLNPIAGRGIEP